MSWRRRNRQYRWVGRLLVCVIVAGNLFPPRVGAKEDCRNEIDRGQGWTTIRPPPTTEIAPLGRVSATYAVDRTDPSLLFVGYRSSLLRSEDGGCSWKEVFSTLDPGAALSLCGGPGAFIQSIDIASSRSRGRSVYLQVVQEGAPAGVYSSSAIWTCLWVSKDGGKTWEPRADGSSADGVLSAAGVGDLIVSPSDPQTLFLTRTMPAVAYYYSSYATVPSFLFVSHDAGMTWERRVLPGAIASPLASDWRYDAPLCSSLSVAPRNARELWGLFINNSGPEGYFLRAEVKLYRSINEGKSWTAIQSGIYSSPSRALDTFPARGGKTGIVTSTTDNSFQGGNVEEVRVSFDSGRSWKTMPVIADIGNTVECAASNERGDLLMVSTSRNIALLYRLPTMRVVAAKTHPLTEDTAADEQSLLTHANRSFYLLIRHVGKNAILLAKYQSN
jgi:hypothetical protein